MGQFRVLGIEGDIKQIWNPDNADEVAAARRTFNDLKAKGHRALDDIKESVAELAYYRKTIFIDSPGPPSNPA